MSNENNNLEDVVESIVERERDPVTCQDCGDIASGRVILEEIINDVHEAGPWVCPDCRPNGVKDDE